MINEKQIEMMLDDDTRYAINVDRLCEMYQLSIKIIYKFDLNILGISNMGELLTGLSKLRDFPNRKTYTIKDIFESFNSNGKPAEFNMEMVVLAILVGYLDEVEK